LLIPDGDEGRHSFWNSEELSLELRDEAEALAGARWSGRMQKLLLLPVLTVDKTNWFLVVMDVVSNLWEVWSPDGDRQAWGVKEHCDITGSDPRWIRADLEDAMHSLLRRIGQQDWKMGAGVPHFVGYYWDAEGTAIPPPLELRGEVYGSHYANPFDDGIIIMWWMEGLCMGRVTSVPPTTLYVVRLLYMIKLANLVSKAYMRKEFSDLHWNEAEGAIV